MISLSAMGTSGHAGADTMPLAETGAAPLLFADYPKSRFGFAGNRFLTEDAHNAAWGGVKAGITRQTAAPLLTGAELVANPGMDTDMAGYTGQLGGTIASVGGKGVITGNGGNTPGMSTPVATAIGSAYGLSADITRGGGELGQNLSAGTNANLTGAALSVSAAATGFYAGTFGGVAPAQYVGTKLNANPANGTGTIDNISCRKALPFAGWIDTATTGISGVIEGIAPAAVASAKVVMQMDDGTERNRVRIVYGTDNHLHLIVTYNNTQVGDIDLGVVAVSNRFRVAFSIASGAFRAAINGMPVQIVTGQNPPGLCYWREGRSFTGETWDGQIEEVAFWPFQQSANMIETLSGDAINCLGDSLTLGAGSTDSSLYSYPAVLSGLYTPVRAVSRNGYGGQDSAYIDAQMATFNRALLSRITIIQAGRNDIGTAVDTLANNVRMAGRVIGGRYLVGSILPSAADGPLGSALSLDRIARNAALQARFGSRFIDLLPALQAAGDGGANDNSDIANGWVPRSLRSDDVHLLNAGYAVVAPTYKAGLVAQGW